MRRIRRCLLVAGAVSLFGFSSAGAVTLYSHYDCVGPGLPETVGPHVTHTDTVSGINCGPVTTFNVNGLAIFGQGNICPTVVSGDSLPSGNVLPEDFTGRWHLTAVCSTGTLNAGTTWLDWIADIDAGIPVSGGSSGTPCSCSPGGTFSVNVTIDLSPTTLVIVGQPAGPIGGILTTISQ